MPEGLLTSYATARNAISQAPRGDMSFTEPEWSPQRARDEEAAIRARDGELRALAAVHEQTGEVAGLTYLRVNRQVGFRVGETSENREVRLAELTGRLRPG